MPATSPTATENLTEAQEAAALFAASFPGLEVKPAMQMLPDGAYLYVSAGTVKRVCVCYTVQTCRAREARRMLEQWNKEGCAA